jgi:hypothetical protein
MVTLDRILVLTEWEGKYPLCSTWSRTRVGSNHWPMFLDTGENTMKKIKQFYFEKQWLLEGNFEETFSNQWNLTRGTFDSQRYSMGIWHGCLSLAR